MKKSINLFFDEIDTDKDGYLSIEQVDKMVEKMIKKRQRGKENDDPEVILLLSDLFIHNADLNGSGRISR